MKHVLKPHLFTLKSNSSGECFLCSFWQHNRNTDHLVLWILSISAYYTAVNTKEWSPISLMIRQSFRDSLSCVTLGTWTLLLQLKIAFTLSPSGPLITASETTLMNMKTFWYKREKINWHYGINLPWSEKWFILWIWLYNNNGNWSIHLSLFQITIRRVECIK